MRTTKRVSVLTRRRKERGSKRGRRLSGRRWKREREKRSRGERRTILED